MRFTRFLGKERNKKTTTELNFHVLSLLGIFLRYGSTKMDWKGSKFSLKTTLLVPTQCWSKAVFFLKTLELVITTLGINYVVSSGLISQFKRELCVLQITPSTPVSNYFCVLSPLTSKAFWVLGIYLQRCSLWVPLVVRAPINEAFHWCRNYG